MQSNNSFSCSRFTIISRVYDEKKCRLLYKFKSLIVIKGRRVKWMRGLFLKYKFSKGTKILSFFFDTRAAIILRRKKGARKRGCEEKEKGKKRRYRTTTRETLKRYYPFNRDDTRSLSVLLRRSVFRGVNETQSDNDACRPILFLSRSSTVDNESDVA